MKRKQFAVILALAMALSTGFSSMASESGNDVLISSETYGDEIAFDDVYNENVIDGELEEAVENISEEITDIDEESFAEELVLDKGVLEDDISEDIISEDELIEEIEDEYDNVIDISESTNNNGEYIKPVIKQITDDDLSLTGVTEDIADLSIVDNENEYIFKGEFTKDNRQEYMSYKGKLKQSCKIVLDGYFDIRKIDIQLIPLTEYNGISWCWWNIYNDGYNDSQRVKTKLYCEANVTAGAYEWRIYPKDGFKGEFAFKVYCTNSAEESFPETGWGKNNSIKDANKISLNKTYKGQLANNDEFDYYKFTLSKKTKIKVDVVRVDTDHEEIQFYIVNKNDKVLKKIEPKTNATSVTLPKGTYYFKADRDAANNRWADGRYTFKIKNASLPDGAEIDYFLKMGTSIDVRWNKVSGVSGYQLKYANNKSFSNAKTVTVSNSSTMSSDKSLITKGFNNLKPGKTYYFKLRTFKKDSSGKKVYSAWSSTASCRISS